MTMPSIFSNKLSKLLLLSLLLTACSPSKEIQKADAIYFGGSIISMHSKNPAPDAIAVKDGKIIAVGSLNQIEKYKDDTTKTVDLQNKTLLPGFIDAHGHFSMVGLLSQSANLAARPEGNSNSVEQIIENLKAHINSPQAKELGWVIGMNYDDSQLDSKNHPTADDLDKVSTEIPVIAVHQSTHVGVVNHKGLEILNYTAATKNPAGGVIQRVAGSQTPNGILEESAFFVAAINIIKPKSEASLLNMLKEAQNAYLAAGFTSAQEGRATPDNINGLVLASQKQQIDIDVAAYPDPIFYQDLNKFESMMNQRTTDYQNHYRIAGIKLSLDGSPQAKTAWLASPYHLPPRGKDKNYKGYPAMTNENLNRYLDLAYQNNWQTLVHSNGDAASDQFIQAIYRVQRNHEQKDLRPVIIHAQVIREDQMDDIQHLKIIPSFMSVHTFYWGDWHRESVLGEDRAESISPTHWALERGILYTTHNDAPVTLPNAMMILSSQVNRITRSGKILGEEQQVDVYSALKSITINAAYQYHEEDTKGSIEVGKLADFVILDKNPLTIDPKDLNRIQVLETIKEGKSLYKK